MRNLLFVFLLACCACGADPSHPNPSTSPDPTSSPSPTASECEAGVTVLDEYTTPDGHYVEVCGRCAPDQALQQGYGRTAPAGPVAATVSMTWSGTGVGRVAAVLRAASTVVDQGQLAQDGAIELSYTAPASVNVSVGLECANDTDTIVDWFLLLQTEGA